MSDFAVDKSASVGKKTTIGNYSVVGPNVVIGAGCQIGHGVIIHADTRIGDAVRIDDGTVIGKMPMRAANSATTKDQELPGTLVSSDCIIGANTVIYRGAELGKKVLVADLATIRENVTVGDFTIVGRGVAIENFCSIGRYCKLETNVYITAYSELGDRVFVAPCVATSNDNFIGRTEERFDKYKGVIAAKGARIGVNATILPGIRLGEDCLIGAGAVVTSDVPAGRIVIGMPAKDFRAVPEEQLLKNQGWPE
jgi:UDP-3-O-[3-hydroxymyristoyl] glucosamine N-acyltransferase